MKIITSLIFITFVGCTAPGRHCREVPESYAVPVEPVYNGEDPPRYDKHGKILPLHRDTNSYDPKTYRIRKPVESDYFRNR